MKRPLKGPTTSSNTRGRIHVYRYTVGLSSNSTVSQILSLGQVNLTPISPTLPCRAWQLCLLCHWLILCQSLYACVQKHLMFQAKHPYPIKKWEDGQMLWHQRKSHQAVGSPIPDSQVHNTHWHSSHWDLCKSLVSWGINWSISEKLNYNIELADIIVCRKIVFHRYCPIIYEFLDFYMLIFLCFLTCKKLPKAIRNCILNEWKHLKKLNPWILAVIIIVTSYYLLSTFQGLSMNLHNSLAQ